MKQIFPMVPAASSAAAVMGAVAAVMLLLILFFVYIAYSSKHVTFEISTGGLEIKEGIYGRFIRSEDLVPESARAVDLTIERALAPSRRVNGTGLPGFRAGWYRLNDGEKALIFVTDERQVAYVPTRRDYSVLVSVPDPQSFVRAVQSIR